MVYISGEKLIQGDYKCKECGIIIRVDNPGNNLPLCPNCDSIEFILEYSYNKKD